MSQGPLAAEARLELLERFAPLLRFDSLEQLRPSAVEPFVTGSALVEDDGSVLDASGPGLKRLEPEASPSLRLNPLSGAENLNSEERSSELLDYYGRQQDLDDPGACYGRVADSEDGHVLYLQYWYFYTDNPCPISYGRHDGDWEFAQLRLLRSGGNFAATHLTLNQHGKPESRALAEGQRPIVYVAVGSHASYFSSGTVPKLPLSDECDGGRSPQSPPRVIELPRPAESSWLAWPGHWGMDRGPGTRLQLLSRGRVPWWLVGFLNRRIPAGDSPASPARQRGSWAAESCYRRGRLHREAGVVLRDLVHFVGKLTWPRVAPAVRAEIDGQGARIVVRPVGHGPRRITRVRVSFEDEATRRPLASRTIHVRDRELSVGLDGLAADSVIWRAAGYNFLRQRGNPIGPVALGAEPPPRLPSRGLTPRTLPLTEGDRSGLILADSHWSDDRRLARWARETFQAILVSDLKRRGAATAEQLYFRLSWFMLPFNHGEIGQLIECAQAGGYIERQEKAIDAKGNGVSDRWAPTEAGEKLKRPRALSLPDLGNRAIGEHAGLSTVFGSVKGVVLAVLPYVVLTGVSSQERLHTYGEIAAVVGALVVLVTVLGKGVMGDLRLRAAAMSWPRLERERPCRYRFQVSYARMGFIPAVLLSVYLTGALAVFDVSAAALLAAALVVGLYVYAAWAVPLQRAWSAEDEDVEKWKEVWLDREEERSAVGPAGAEVGPGG